MRYLSLSLLSGALLLAGSAYAENAHLPEDWTPASLQANLLAMPTGDVERGKLLNSEFMCASCHGEHGQALTRNWPSLAGQRVEYTYKTLQDYAEGRFAQHTGAEAMAAAASMLTQQQMADLSVYYAQFTLPTATITQVDMGEDKGTDIMVRKGDAKRLITPCASCHGVNGEGGINETPALAGQEPYYFERSMQAYKQGTRATDTHSAMRFFASKLTDEEIKALAQYYAKLPPVTR